MNYRTLGDSQEMGLIIDSGTGQNVLVLRWITTICTLQLGDITCQWIVLYTGLNMKLYLQYPKLIKSKSGLFNDFDLIEIVANTGFQYYKEVDGTSKYLYLTLLGFGFGVKWGKGEWE